MAAISSRHDRSIEIVARGALVVGGVLAVGIGAVAAPVVLGLMSAVVLHTLRVSAGQVPVLLLAAVHLFDIGVLVGAGVALRTGSRRVGAHRAWW